MPKVTAKCQVKTDKISDFKKIAEKLVDETRAKDDYISYELFQDSNNENIFMFIEEWDTQEKLDNHSATDHFNEFVDKINELLAKPIDILVMNLIK